MKIVFFTENSYKGGLDTFIISLINNWPDKKDEIVLICNKSHPGIETYESQINRPAEFRWHKIIFLKDIRTYLFHAYGNIQLLAKIAYNLIKIFKPLLIFYYLFALRKIIFNENPDRLFIINGGYPAGISCRIASICWGIFNKKKRLSVHNFHNFAIKSSKYDFLENIIDRFVEKYSSKLISVSQSASESIRSRKYFKNSSKIDYIYNGISIPEAKKINTTELQNKLELKDNSLLCLMLGTYEIRKGHEFLLKSFVKVVKNVPDAYLIICGYGSATEIKVVEEIIKRYNLENNVSLFGFRNDIDDILSITKLLLISSQSFESFGLTAVEAMARNVPVVSTNTGGLKEVISNGNGGYVFDNNDVENYANKVIALLNNEELRCEQGKKGYERVLKYFTLDQMVNQYYKIIKE